MLSKKYLKFERILPAQETQQQNISQKETKRYKNKKINILLEIQIDSLNPYYIHSHQPIFFFFV